MLLNIYIYKKLKKAYYIYNKYYCYLGRELTVFVESGNDKAVSKTDRCVLKLSAFFAD